MSRETKYNDYGMATTPFSTLPESSPLIENISNYTNFMSGDNGIQSILSSPLLPNSERISMSTDEIKSYSENPEGHLGSINDLEDGQYRQEQMDYVEFLHKNQVIVRFWERHPTFNNKIEHVSLEIPDKHFYRAIAVERKEENGMPVEDAKFITNYADDRRVMRRGADKCEILFHLNVDLIMGMCQELAEKKPKYNLYISSGVDNEEECIDPVELNCAMFLRAAMEHGGLNVSMSMPKARFNMGRMLFLILSMTYIVLEKKYDLLNTDSLRGLYAATGISAFYAFRRYVIAMIRFCWGQRFVNTTPKGVFELCKEVSRYEIEEAVCITSRQFITDGQRQLMTDTDIDLPNICTWLCSVVIPGAMGSSMVALGTKILARHSPDYDVTLNTKTMALGAALFLPVFSLYKLVQLKTVNNRPNVHAPIPTIGMARETLMVGGYTEKLDQLCEGLLATFFALLTGIFCIKALTGETASFTDIFLSGMVGTSTSLVPLCCCFTFICFCCLSALFVNNPSVARPIENNDRKVEQQTITVAETKKSNFPLEYARSKNYDNVSSFLAHGSRPKIGGVMPPNFYPPGLHTYVPFLRFRH